MLFLSKARTRICCVYSRNKIHVRIFFGIFFGRWPVKAACHSIRRRVCYSSMFSLTHSDIMDREWWRMWLIQGQLFRNLYHRWYNFIRLIKDHTNILFPRCYYPKLVFNFQNFKFLFVLFLITYILYFPLHFVALYYSICWFWLKFLIILDIFSYSYIKIYQLILLFLVYHYHCNLFSFSIKEGKS